MTKIMHKPYTSLIPCELSTGIRLLRYIPYILISYANKSNQANTMTIIHIIALELFY